MKARSCWSFPSPKRSSTFPASASQSTDATHRYFIPPPSFRGAQSAPHVIPGRAKREPGISRFRVWPGACHRAAQRAGPLGPSGMTPFRSTNLVVQRYKSGVQTELFMQDLWRLSATDVAALIRSKKITAKEAASAALARLDAVNPKINAVVDHRPKDVLAQAEAIDAAIASKQEAGPLAGVPVTVKVNIDQQGFATTNGLKLQRDVIATTNSPVIDNLRKAGAV